LPWCVSDAGCYLITTRLELFRSSSGSSSERPESRTCSWGESTVWGCSPVLPHSIRVYVPSVFLRLTLVSPPPAALAKGISEVEPAAAAAPSQNGAPPGKKSPPPAPLPELEYREKGKDGTAKEREGKKQQQQPAVGINNNSIVHALDSKLQEAEYIENCVGAKRLNNDLVGEGAHADANVHAHAHAASKEEAAGAAAGKNYKNASAGGGGNVSNSSPRNHSSSNGGVPPGASTNKNEKKQKGAGKGQKDPVENCIPNNQLGKPDALVR